MTDLSRINQPYRGIIRKTDVKLGKDQQTTGTAQDSTVTTQQPATTQQSADDVYKFMNQTAYRPLNLAAKSEGSDKTSKVIKVSNFVSPEQAKRISQSVKQYENKIASYEQVASNEFNIPKPLAQNIAVQTFANQDMIS